MLFFGRNRIENLEAGRRGRGGGRILQAPRFEGGAPAGGGGSLVNSLSHRLRRRQLPLRGSLFRLRAGREDLIRHSFAVPPSPKGEGFAAAAGRGDFPLQGRLSFRILFLYFS